VWRRELPGRPRRHPPARVRRRRRARRAAQDDRLRRARRGPRRPLLHARRGGRSPLRPRRDRRRPPRPTPRRRPAAARSHQRRLTSAGVPWYAWLAVSIGVIIVLWAAGVAALVAGGRETEARALAQFIPDCVVLFKRLLADPAVPEVRKIALALAVGYL